jgi:large subunit ribosomal protein L7/L12
MFAARVGVRRWLAQPSTLRALHARRALCAPAAAAAAAADAAATPGGDGDAETPAHIRALTESIAALSLVEAAALSRDLRARLGLGDAPLGGGMAFAPAGGAAGGGAASADADDDAGAAAAERTEFDVVLAGFDAKGKIKVIKEVRAATGLGLKEAKDAVERSADAPQVLAKGVAKEDAEKLAAVIREAGGTVEVK